MASFDYDVLIIGSGFGGSPGQIDAAVNRGLQTRDAELALGRVLGELTTR